MILAVLGPDKLAGAFALSDDTSRRTATVTALQFCETITLNRTEFGWFRARHVGVELFLLASLVSQVNQLSEELLETLFVPVAGRVARRLLVLSDEFRGEDITLTQHDLALIAGTTRSTVNEVLETLSGPGRFGLGSPNSSSWSADFAPTDLANIELGPPDRMPVTFCLPSMAVAAPLKADMVPAGKSRP